MNTVVVFSKNVLVLSLDFDESVYYPSFTKNNFVIAPLLKGMTLPKWVL